MVQANKENEIECGVTKHIVGGREAPTAGAQLPGTHSGGAEERLRRNGRGKEGVVSSHNYKSHSLSCHHIFVGLQPKCPQSQPNCWGWGTMTHLRGV